MQFLLTFHLHEVSIIEIATRHKFYYTFRSSYMFHKINCTFYMLYVYNDTYIIIHFQEIS